MRRLESALRPACTSPNSRPASTTRRSEEHTSELQSRSDLVCRLLLEKKKNRTVAHTYPEYQNLTTHPAEGAPSMLYALLFPRYNRNNHRPCAAEGIKLAREYLEIVFL